MYNISLFERDGTTLIVGTHLQDTIAVPLAATATYDPALDSVEGSGQVFPLDEELVARMQGVVQAVADFVATVADAATLFARTSEACALRPLVMLDAFNRERRVWADHGQAARHEAAQHVVDQLDSAEVVMFEGVEAQSAFVNSIALPDPNSREAIWRASREWARVEAALEGLQGGGVPTQSMVGRPCVDCADLAGVYAQIPSLPTTLAARDAAEQAGAHLSAPAQAAELILEELGWVPERRTPAAEAMTIQVSPVIIDTSLRLAHVWLAPESEGVPPLVAFRASLCGYRSMIVLPDEADPGPVPITTRPAVEVSTPVGPHGHLVCNLDTVDVVRDGPIALYGKKVGCDWSAPPAPAALETAILVCASRSTAAAVGRGHMGDGALLTVGLDALYSESDQVGDVYALVRMSPDDVRNHLRHRTAAPDASTEEITSEDEVDDDVG